MIKFLAEIANVSEKDTIINTISEGSTIIDCVVSANSPEQAESLKLSISKASYPFPIISSSYGVFTSQTEEVKTEINESSEIDET